MGLDDCPDLICRQIGPPIQFDDSTATSFALAYDLFPGHESNATQNPVKGHELIRPFQGMGHCINGQARSLRDELLIQRLAFAQLPFRMARMVWVRCVIQVVAIEAAAPPRNPMPQPLQ